MPSVVGWWHSVSSLLAVVSTICGGRPTASRRSWPWLSGSGTSGSSPPTRWRGTGLGNDAVVGPAASEGLSAPGVQPARPEPAEAAKPKTVVPVWRAGLAWSALSMDHQRILQARSDRNRLGQGALTCQETAACFGLDAVPGKVEAPRSKAKRLTARGWLIEPTPGRFTLAKDEAGQRGGS